MDIVYKPESRHYCGPNDHGIWLDAFFFDPEGTVRECCGKTWVAFQDRRDPGYMGVKWRRESWLARRQRTKRNVAGR